MIKQVICTECPMGCEVSVELKGQTIVNVTGNTCPRGKAYAMAEAVCPTRIITSTVRAVNGGIVPVKTDKPVKKSAMFEVMAEINAVKCFTPVRVGDIIVRDIQDGVNLIATGELN